MVVGKTLLTIALNALKSYKNKASGGLESVWKLVSNA
jgi:hypothetical protein